MGGLGSGPDLLPCTIPTSAASKLQAYLISWSEKALSPSLPKEPVRKELTQTEHSSLVCRELGQTIESAIVERFFSDLITFQFSYILLLPKLPKSGPVLRWNKCFGESIKLRFWYLRTKLQSNVFNYFIYSCSHVNCIRRVFGSQVLLAVRTAATSSWTLLCWNTINSRQSDRNHSRNRSLVDLWILYHELEK